MSKEAYIIISFFVWLLFHFVAKYFYKNGKRVYTSMTQLYIYWAISFCLTTAISVFYMAIWTNDQIVANYIGLLIDDDVQFLSLIFVLMYVHSHAKHAPY